MTAIRGRLGGGGMEQKGKSTHGHGQQCGDCRGVQGDYKVIEKMQ